MSKRQCVEEPSSVLWGQARSVVLRQSADMLHPSDMQCLTSTCKQLAAERGAIHDWLHSRPAQVRIMRHRMKAIGVQWDDMQLEALVKVNRPCRRCYSQLAVPGTGLVCLVCEFKTAEALRSRCKIPAECLAVSTTLKRLVVDAEFKSPVSKKQCVGLAFELCSRPRMDYKAVAELFPMISAECALAAAEIVAQLHHQKMTIEPLLAVCLLATRVVDAHHMEGPGSGQSWNRLDGADGCAYQYAFNALKEAEKKAATGPAFLAGWVAPQMRLQMGKEVETAVRGMYSSYVRHA